MAKQMRKACSTNKVRPNELWGMYVRKVASNYSGSTIKTLGPKAVKDLQKVNFDFENFSNSHLDERIGEDIAFLGYRALYIGCNDMPFIGCRASGDWEYPVYFIIYLEPNGKTFRCYVPKDGNTWNYDTKQAFGNDEEADLKFAKKHLKDITEFNPDDSDVFLDFYKMVSEIRSRFVVVD